DLGRVADEGAAGADVGEVIGVSDPGFGEALAVAGGALLGIRQHALRMQHRAGGQGKSQENGSYCPYPVQINLPLHHHLCLKQKLLPFTAGTLHFLPLVLMALQTMPRRFLSRGPRFDGLDMFFIIWVGFWGWSDA